MIPLQNRLHSEGINLPPGFEDKTLTWNFSEWKKGNFEAFKCLTADHRLIEIEYRVLRQQLAADLSSQRKICGDAAQRLIFALELAEVLEHVYHFYLNVPDKAEQLKDEQSTYRDWLPHLGYHADRRRQFATRTRSSSSFSGVIRQTTATTNWPRLLIVRIKRVLDAMDTLVTGFRAYKNAVKVMDRVANPIFSYLAWIFYAPRLSSNSFFALKHSISVSWWMHEEERSLDLLMRLKVQFDRRWFEMANDAVWFAVGFVNCFILIGALAPAAVYLTVSLYLFDVLLSGLRAYAELNPLYRLLNDYNTLMLEGGDSNQHWIQDYKKCLEERVQYERSRLILSIITTSSLLLAMCLTLPLIASSPIITLTGVSLVVAVCISSYVAGKKLEKMKPNDNIPKYKSVVPSPSQSTQNLFKSQLLAKPKPNPPQGNDKRKNFSNMKNRRV